MTESGLADTSLLVRYLTGEPAGMAERATKVVENVEGLHITDVVLAETAYVLQSVYRVPRADIVGALQDLIMRRNIEIRLRKDRVVEALELCRPSGRVSFADALVWADAASDLSRRLYTFDERFPTDEIEVVIP